MPRIYFARAVDGLDLRSTLSDARRLAASMADVELLLIDPLIDEPDASPAPGETALRHRAVVEHDLSILRSCDAVLMDMTLPGRNYIGCSCELVYAHLWGIPAAVYLGANDQNRPWLQYHASAVLGTQAEAVEYLRQLL